jgi:hypothetical protein
LAKALNFAELLQAAWVAEPNWEQPLARMARGELVNPLKMALKWWERKENRGWVLRWSPGELCRRSRRP